MSPCPTEMELRAFLTGAVTAVEQESLAGHLDGCPACLQRLGRFDLSADPLVGALRGPAPDDTPMEPAVRRLLGEAPPLAVGGRIGPYVLLEKLGEGGMGAVYRVRHDKLGKVFALKLMPPGWHHDADRAARFEREMRAVGRLEHPHIVRATDAGEHGGLPFLAMELVEGTDLARLVRKRGPLRPADACEAVRQAALALQHAHDRGLIHRDVKPSNLLLTADGVVKLLDLGLALAADEPAFAPGPAPAGDRPTEVDTHPHSMTLTATGFALGTREYMAPEQATDPHGVDARADVYGLGATLHFLLTGRSPGPADLGPEGLRAVLARLLAADPADRYASAAEAADVLARRANGHDLAAVANGRPPRSHRGRRRTAVAAVCFLAAGGMVAIAALPEIQDRHPDKTPPPDPGVVAAPQPPPPGGPEVAPMPRPKPPPPPGELPMDSAEAHLLQMAWAKYLGQEVTETGPAGVETVLIPPGTFEMAPEYLVRITRPYRLGTTEVTRGQFRKFVEAAKYVTTREASDPLQGIGISTHAFGVHHVRPGDTGTWNNPDFRVSNDRFIPYPFSPFIQRVAAPVFQGNDDYPVTHISHPDAEKFVEWLSKVEGKKYRLPTEAEWRWAARAGVNTRHPLGDGLPVPGKYYEYAVYDIYVLGTRNPVTTGFPVPHYRQVRPNAWGLYHMLGNLREWVADGYLPYPRGVFDDPGVGPQPHDTRVLCGGCYNNRIDIRNVTGAHPDTCDFNTRKEAPYYHAWREHGFRVCREP